MKISGILERITVRAQELGLSDNALSQKATGSNATIRNWRRAEQEGRDVGPQLTTLRSVANALNVSVDYLLGETPQSQVAKGFSEHAVPFALAEAATSPEDPQRSLRALFGTAIITPATYRVGQFLPQFSIRAGDVLVCDLSRLPQPGELALASVMDSDTGTAATIIARYLPPWLILGAECTTPPLRVDDPSVTVRCPIGGVLRGLLDTPPQS